jgi:hypothetical protein
VEAVGAGSERKQHVRAEPRIRAASGAAKFDLKNE